MNNSVRNSLINNKRLHFYCYKFIFNTILIIIILSIISFYFAGIIFLIQNYNEFYDCNKSNIWTYVLISLLGSLITTYLTLRNFYREDYNYSYLISLMLINILSAIWGGFEIWDYLCDNLYSNNLTNFAILQFFIQSAITLMLLSFLSIYMCYII